MSKTETPSRATLARRKNAAARRSRVLAEGGRRLELLLSPAATQALDKLLHRGDGATATEVIEGLLLQAAAKRR